MTPDEKEVWLTNPNDRRLWVFDATVMPPKRKQSIEVNCQSHGWITFSIDGKSLIRSSKFIEIHFRAGKPVRVGDQFGIGRAAPTID